MELRHLFCALLVATSAYAADTSNPVYRLVVENRARRSIHDELVYKIPKGTTEFVLDFYKVLESPFFNPDPPAKTSAITSVVVSLPGDRLYHAYVKDGQNSVHLGPDTLRDILDRKSFKSFGDASFTIDIGTFKKEVDSDSIIAYVITYEQRRSTNDNIDSNFGANQALFPAG